jgi:hypothetical protein
VYPLAVLKIALPTPKDEAVALDPKYPTAYYALGLVHTADVYLGLSKNRKESLESSNKMLQKAIALDGKLYICVQATHVTPGNLRAFVQARLRSLTGRLSP